MSVEGLGKSYGSFEVFKDVSFKVEPGEIFVLMGPSGAGKSVLLRQIVGLERPTAGRVLINGHDAASEETREQVRIGLVFQAGALFNSLSVYDNLALYPREHRVGSEEQIRKKVMHALQILSLDGTADKFPADLSGGMKKRVSIARALVMEPQLLLYDEPTSELDPVMSATISEIIATLKDEYKVTSIVVTHDRDLALNIADRVGILMDHRPDPRRAALRPAAPRPTPRMADFLNPKIDVQQSAIQRNCESEPEHESHPEIRTMNNAQQTARVGLFFLIGIALIWVTYETLSGDKLFKPQGYTLIAGFDDMKELKVGDDVRMAGVKIGQVEKTRLTGRRAEAVLRINPGFKVAGDATATISMAGLLGGNYIGIDLGAGKAGRLADGAEIHTASTPDINSIMTDLGNLGEKLQGALGTFGTVMNGNGKNGGEGLFQKLDEMVTEDRPKVSATLSEHREHLGQDQPRRGHGGQAGQRSRPARPAAGRGPGSQGHGRPCQHLHGRRPAGDRPRQGRPGDAGRPGLRPADGGQPQGHGAEHPAGLGQARQRPGHPGQADQRRLPLPHGPEHDQEGRPRPRQHGRFRPHHGRRHRGQFALLSSGGSVRAEEALQLAAGRGAQG